MRKSRRNRGLALASAAALVALSSGGMVGAAAADPGGQPNSHANGHANGKDKDKGDKGKGNGKDKDKGDKGKGNGNGKDKDDKGNGKGNGDKGKDGKDGKGNSHGNGNGNGNGNGHGGGQQTQHGDPPGNNGTVKIAAPGDEVGHPSNNPHPGCTVVVEWFGYDEGQDVVSTVSFAPQAPTSGAVIGGTSPTQVFVGGDPASGGTDLDGRQAYELTFTGEPHPKQGFHVKLTVATPRSLGNDTKTKVFWVEPCADEPITTTPSEDGETPEQDGDSPDDTEGPTFGTDDGETTSGGEEDAGVLGTTAEAADPGTATEDVASGDVDAAVPTAVDAGENGSVLPDWARSPIPVHVLGGGLVLVAGGGAARRRRGG